MRTELIKLNFVSEDLTKSERCFCSVFPLVCKSFAVQFCTPTYMGFPGGSDGKEPACSAGDLGLVPGLGRSPGGGHGNPLQYSCLENLHGQRSLVGYSPWGRKESDMTEQLSTHSTRFLGAST